MALSVTNQKEKTMSGTIPKGMGKDDNVNRNPGKKDTVRIYQDRNGEYRWKRMRANGRIISDSGEGYTTRRRAVEGMRMANADWQESNVRVVDHTQTEVDTDE